MPLSLFILGGRGGLARWNPPRAGGGGGALPDPCVDDRAGKGGRVTPAGALLGLEGGGGGAAALPEDATDAPVRWGGGPLYPNAREGGRCLSPAEADAAADPPCSSPSMPSSPCACLLAAASWSHRAPTAVWDPLTVLMRSEKLADLSVLAALSLSAATFLASSSLSRYCPA